LGWGRNGGGGEGDETPFVFHKQNLIKPNFIPLIQEDSTRMRGKTVWGKDRYKYCGRGNVLVLRNKEFVKGGGRMYGEWGCNATQSLFGTKKSEC